MSPASTETLLDMSILFSPNFFTSCVMHFPCRFSFSYAWLCQHRYSYSRSNVWLHMECKILQIRSLSLHCQTLFFFVLPHFPLLFPWAGCHCRWSNRAPTISLYRFTRSCAYVRENTYNWDTIIWRSSEPPVPRFVCVVVQSFVRTLREWELVEHNSQLALSVTMLSSQMPLSMEDPVSLCG